MTGATTALMPALRWHGRYDLRLEQVPVPEPAPGQILVAVERVGLCGTDLEEYTRGPVDVCADRPVILGHEIVGTVAACPGGELSVGDRVIPDVVLGCGHCWWCERHQPGQCADLVVRGLQTDGGLARYLLAEASTAVVVPANVPADVAAFAEPASVAVRALRKAGSLTGAVVAVLGAGTIGLLVARLAVLGGAGGVLAVDPLPQRRDLARRFGATWTVEPGQAASSARAITDGRGADVVLECSGADAATSSAPAVARTGGTVVLVGTGNPTISLPVRDIVLREQRLFGSAAHVWDEDVAAAVAVLADGALDPRPLLTDVVGLPAAVEHGFQRLANDPIAIKILVSPER